jgi:site-specific recombinase XerD
MAVELRIVAKNAPVEPVARPEELQKLLEAAQAKNTARVYASGWKHFATWCRKEGRDALPASPATVQLYIAAHQDIHKVATIQHRLIAIAAKHKQAQLQSPVQDPEVSRTMKGLRRTKGVVPQQKRALLTADLQEILAQLPKGPAGTRDRALLLLGYAGALRRSEIAALDHRDVEFHGDGMTLTLRKSKTDQEGAGRRIGIPFGQHPNTCPVRCLKKWMERSERYDGAIFRRIDQYGNVLSARLSPQGIAIVCKRAAGKAGIPQEEIGGHSLRAGFATQAAMNGATELQIMQQTGHRSLAMVRRYIREGSLFRDNPAGKLGL